MSVVTGRNPLIKHRIYFTFSVLLALAAFFIFASSVGAHAVLLETTPGDGDLLDSPPEEVVLRFNEPVEPPTNALRVLNSSGEQVDLGDYGRGDQISQLRVGLPDDLPDGAYLVSWRAISADTHIVSGSFIFAVGDAVPDAEALAELEDSGSGRIVSLAIELNRIVLYIASLLAAGGLIVAVVVFPAGATNNSRIRYLVSGSALVALAATLLGTGLHVVDYAGARWGALLEPAAFSAGLENRIGMSSAIRAVGLVGVIAGLGVLKSLHGRWIAVVSAVLVPGSFALVGHTATAEPQWLAIFANLSHSIAGSIWFGGLAMLLLTAYYDSASRGPIEFGTVVARFSTLAGGCVALVAFGGVVLGWMEVQGFEALFSTTYGQVLLLKVGLVALVLIVAGYNNRRLVPAIVQQPGERHAWSRLRTTVGLEVLGLIAVVAITAVLVNLTPARTAVVQPLGPFEGSEVVEEYTYTLAVSPNRAGVNDIELSIMDGNGQPADAAQGILFRISSVDHETGVTEREPHKMSTGHYHHQGGELALGGKWEITVVVRLSDFELIRVPFELSVDQ